MKYQDEDLELREAIQENLRQIATHLGQDQLDIDRIYEDAIELTQQASPAPLTLARVAGALLVYQSQAVEPEEVRWFKSQLQQCQDAEEIEELVESISRIDSL